MKNSPFFAQANLLVRCLPALSAAECFALKGGTAINLFERDLPRLSVDIDLAYLPLSPRGEALRDIADGMQKIAERAQTLVPGLRMRTTGTADSLKQTAATAEAQIKIEPNTVMRGVVFPAEVRRLSAAAEEIFEISATATVAPVPDLYAGKLCAALDRGHPRDWFDVMPLLNLEAFDDRLRQAFVVYLASHSRPIAELLEPRSRRLDEHFVREFAGMPRQPITAAELESTQARLPELLRSRLSEAERRFLLSIKLGEPAWDLLPIPHLQKLPALLWKLDNVEALKRNPRRHADAVARLRRVLEL